MNKKLKTSLLQCLLSAVSHYDRDSNEEQGGFILKQANEENYEYVPVRNSITGTDRAVTLYIADQLEFNNKIASRTLDDEWEVYASFHTHPKGMRAMPSGIDLDYLFTSFPINYIYAPYRELNCFEFMPEHKHHKSPIDKWRISAAIRFEGFSESSTKLNEQHKEKINQV